jgi:hypothetical protein
MKNNIIIIITTLAIALASCEKRLDEMRPHNQPEEESYLGTLENIIHSTAGVYSFFSYHLGKFSDLYTPHLAIHSLGEFRGNNVIFAEAFSDGNLNLMGTDAHYFLNSDQKKYSFAWTIWAKANQAVLNTSKNIIAIDKYLASGLFSTDDAQKLARLKGENLFLRGLMLFTAVNVFARPFWDEPDVNPGMPLDTLGTGKSLRQATTRQTFERIVKDFRDAATLLPDEAADHTFANRAAAFGLLSRAYLYMGGTGDAPDAGYNALAIAYADSTFALREDRVALLRGEDARGLFDNPKRSTELLFSFVMSNFKLELPSSNYIHNYYSWSYFEASKETSQHSCVISKDYEKIMDKANDLRWIYWTEDASYLPYVGRYSVTTKYNGGATDLFEGWGYYVFDAPLVFIRAGEVVLNRAEARAKTGDATGALADLNDIRGRAGLQPLSGLSGKDLLDAIFLERRRELAFEGHVYYDYMRDGRAMKREEISPAYAEYTGAVHNEMDPRASRRTTCPIPAEELLLNPELVPNN